MGKYQLIGGNQMKFKINNGAIKQEEEVIELEQLLASMELMGEEPLESRSIVIQKAALNKKLQDYSNRKQDFSLVRVKIKQGFVV